MKLVKKLLKDKAVNSVAVAVILGFSITGFLGSIGYSIVPLFQNGDGFGGPSVSYNWQIIGTQLAALVLGILAALALYWYANKK